MTKPKNRNSWSSADQSQKMKMMLRDLWGEVWSAASNRHHDEQQFDYTKPRKEKPEDKYSRFSTESGFSGRNRTHH
jgi:hypothetical protein